MIVDSQECQLINQNQNNHFQQEGKSKKMIQQSSISGKCLFCIKMHMEKRLLFFKLFKTLSKELQKLREESQNEVFQTEGNSFKQLLRIIFGEQATQQEVICQHKKYLTYFTNKLNCSINVLDFLSQRLAQKLAQKHYHLQLLSIQIKNSAESIADGKIRLDDEEQSSSDMSNKFRRLRTKQKVEAQKVKNQMGQEGNEGILQTGSTLAGNSLSFIPMYNSQINVADTSQGPITLANVNNIGIYYPYQIYYSHQNQ